MWIAYIEGGKIDDIEIEGLYAKIKKNELGYKALTEVYGGEQFLVCDVSKHIILKHPLIPYFVNGELVISTTIEKVKPSDKREYDSEEPDAILDIIECKRKYTDSLNEEFIKYLDTEKIKTVLEKDIKEQMALSVFDYGGKIEIMIAENDRPPFSAIKLKKGNHGWSAKMFVLNYKQLDDIPEKDIDVIEYDVYKAVEELGINKVVLKNTHIKISDCQWEHIIKQLISGFLRGYNKGQ